VTPVPQPGRHGGDGPAVARALGLDPSEVLDLSLSLNPCAPDVTALAARHLESLRHYPDPSTATRLLADAIGVDSDRIVLTNGGAEAISLARARFGGTVASEPEFALHPRTGVGPTWRSDPHNPSGRLATADEHVDVWDEAFYPLATGRWTAARPSLATVGSLTKLFACPGLRLGYLIADGITPPLWSVNSLALALLPDLLEAAELDKWAREVAELRAELADVLEANGLVPEPSDANWVLVEAPGLRDRLAHHGVVIRDCTSFGLPHHVRIAVPDERGLDRLSTALAR
jgi:histidinol-phosphate/aromatic aminotransferase/cobyric acid decarboxylase-like protein